jgi:peptide/nickel transport system permease protein
MSKLARLASGYLFVFFIALSLNFFLPRWMPGEPLQLIAGNAVRQMGKERIAALRAEYGLDRPLGEQYWIYLKQVASGNLGQSYRYSGGKPVGRVLAESFTWTLFLVTASLLLAITAGLILGLWTVWQTNPKRDLVLTATLFTLRSIPPFWLAMLMIPIFAVTLGWFPSGDSYSIPRLKGFANLIDVSRHAVMPVVVLALAYLPSAYAITRSSMQSVIGSEYILAARARGLGERKLVFHHALRNALLPLVTFFCLDFGQLLGGVTLIEMVFNYRGIGNLMFEAVKGRDYPMLQGGFLLFTSTVLLINFILDWIYPRLDPRVR